MMEDEKILSCGCGHEHEHDHEHCDCEALETIELELDDGKKMSCSVIGIFDCVEGYDGEYIALLPEDSEDVMFYAYSEDDEANPILDNIESDEEYDAVCDTFMSLIDEDEDE